MHTELGVTVLNVAIQSQFVLNVRPVFLHMCHAATVKSGRTHDWTVIMTGIHGDGPVPADFTEAYPQKLSFE